VEEPVNNRSLINITLQEDATTLKEVVINAGYYNTTEKERTGSISRVTASEIESQPITNPLEALQGRMSGVNITQNSGVAGGSFSINIRGRNSIRADGNEPLYVIDGVPYLSQSLGDIQVSNVLGTLPSSPLNHISPANIESVEILKDADATAIYGSRGANGVVLITTKKAKVDGSSFKLNINSGFGQITRTMKLMNTEQYI
jgi:TonB-dependent SusC/RagA subfamily outer membrane receptor